MDKLNFVVVDVETSNLKNKASICQIAIVTVENGKITDTYSSLVNPQSSYWPNTDYHGITKEDVEKDGIPLLKEIEPIVRELLTGKNVIAHNVTFDKGALNAVCEKIGKQHFDCNWGDSIRLSKLAWPEYETHKLSYLAKRIGFDLNHHDALSDALCCVSVVIEACKVEGVEFSEAFVSKTNGNSSSYRSAKRLASIGKIHAPEVDLSVTTNDMKNNKGEIIAIFTGTFSRSKAQVQNEAKELGCVISKNATTKVTVCVVGNNGQKSGKQETIEKFNSKRDFQAPILTEDAFFAVLKGEEIPESEKEREEVKYSDNYYAENFRPNPDLIDPRIKSKLGNVQVVFTGQFEYCNSDDLKDYAEHFGWKVLDNESHNMTLLVAGKINANTSSIKRNERIVNYVKKLNENGRNIPIFNEKEYLQVV